MRAPRERQMRLIRYRRSSADAIITIKQDRTIQWVNAAVNRVLGCQPIDSLGRKIDIPLS
jgi:hypothetical protein